MVDLYPAAGYGSCTNLLTAGYDLLPDYLDHDLSVQRAESFPPNRIRAKLEPIFF